MFKTVDDLIEAVGGTGAAAALTGVGPSAVSNWKALGKIPAGYFWVFAAVLPGKTPTQLFGFKREPVG